MVGLTGGANSLRMFTSFDTINDCDARWTERTDRYHMTARATLAPWLGRSHAAKPDPYN